MASEKSRCSVGATGGIEAAISRRAAPVGYEPFVGRTGALQFLPCG